MATAAALVALFIVARRHYLDSPVRSVSVNIDRVADSGFVKKSDVLAEVSGLCGDFKIGSVNMIAIEERLKSNPWVEHSSTHIGLDGKMNISIREYQPVLRVYAKNGISAYVTAEGLLLPPSDTYTPHVLIANGNFQLAKDFAGHQLCDTLEADHNILNAIKLLDAINHNEFMKNCIGQIYCNGKDEFEIVARNIRPRIIFGDTNNLDDKLKRLEIFIKQKFNSLEIKQLKSINLKYKNQIVCTKITKS